MQRKIVPDVVREQKLAQVPETMTVRDAASLMAKRHIGAEQPAQLRRVERQLPGLVACEFKAQLAGFGIFALA